MNLALSVLPLMLGFAMAAAPAVSSAESDSPSDTARLVDVLGERPLNALVLSTIFRFAADFNEAARPVRPDARIVGVQEDFAPSFVPLLKDIRVSTVPDDARSQARVRLRRFLDGYVGFLLVRPDVSDAIVLRRSETVQMYLADAAARGRCNEIPCSRPPCCNDCSAPPGTPPQCPEP